MAPSAQAQVTEAGFEQYKAQVRARAARSGISDAVLRQALDPAQLDREAIELDGRRPDSGSRQRTFAENLGRRVGEFTVNRGRELYQQHRQLVHAAGNRYGVPPTILIALWGTETAYGRYTGGHKVIDATLSLAYEGRRRQLFEDNVIEALKIIQQGHIRAEDMTGSWAGAMGQCQFLPASFNAYAVDFTGDGRKDIWNTLGDVFGSSANYLASNGWRAGERWGRPVRLPSGLSRSLIDSSVRRTVDQWSAQGVRAENGASLPRSDMQGHLLQPDGAGTQAWLCYHNFRVLKRWNNSNLFGVTVGTLSDRIA